MPAIVLGSVQSTSTHLNISPNPFRLKSSMNEGTQNLSGDNSITTLQFGSGGVIHNQNLSDDQPYLYMPAENGPAETDSSPFRRNKYKALQQVN